jgi:hypothetical protein
MPISPAGSPPISPLSMMHAAVSAEQANGDQTALPTLSDVHNVGLSMSFYDLPTYEEAMAGTDRTVTQHRPDDLPTLEQLISESEGVLMEDEGLPTQLEKWVSLGTELQAFAISDIAMTNASLAGKTKLAAEVVMYWINMVKHQPDLRMASGPYEAIMSSTKRTALGMIRSLCNHLSNDVDRTESLDLLAGRRAEFASRLRAFMIDVTTPD